MTRVALSIMLLLAFAPAAFAQNPSASPAALARRLAIEGGAGLGFWDDSGGGSEVGFGLILGGSVSILKPGPHLLTAGVTYMPVFTSSMTIHAVGFVIGYQYIRIR
jgi:hypothetical protein